MKLTEQQKRFADEYLIDLNATAAYKRAGYKATGRSAENAASRLLGNVGVKEYIAERMKAREQRTEITQDMVLRELAKIGFSDIRKVVKWGNTKLQLMTDGDDGPPIMVEHHGLALTAADEIDDDTAAAISEISQGKEGLKVKFHDKKGALVDLGRHLGMFPAKVDVTTKGKELPAAATGVLVVPAVMSDAAWEAMMQEQGI